MIQLLLSKLRTSLSSPSTLERLSLGLPSPVPFILRAEIAYLGSVLGLLQTAS